MKRKCFTTVMAMVSLGLCLRALNTCCQSASGMLYSDDYVHTVGVGFQLGTPIGVTAKYWLTQYWAVDGAFGISPSDHTPAEFHADFLVNDFNILNPNSGKAPVYFGGGIVTKFRNDGRSDLFGFRFPVGVSYMFENIPIDVFAEVAPEIIVAPFRRGNLGGAVGVRFWF